MEKVYQIRIAFDENDVMKIDNFRQGVSPLEAVGILEALKKELLDQMAWDDTPDQFSAIDKLKRRTDFDDIRF